MYHLLRLFKLFFFFLLLIGLVPWSFARDYDSNLDKIDITGSGNTINVSIGVKGKNQQPKVYKKKIGEHKYVIDVIGVGNTGVLNKNINAQDVVDSEGVNLGVIPGGTRIIVDLKKATVHDITVNTSVPPRSVVKPVQSSPKLNITQSSPRVLPIKEKSFSSMNTPSSISLPAPAQQVIKPVKNKNMNRAPLPKENLDVIYKSPHLDVIYKNDSPNTSSQASIKTLPLQVVNKSATGRNTEKENRNTRAVVRVIPLQRQIKPSQPLSKIQEKIGQNDKIQTNKEKKILNHPVQQMKSEVMTHQQTGLGHIGTETKDVQGIHQETESHPLQSPSMLLVKKEPAKINPSRYNSENIPLNLTETQSTKQEVKPNKSMFEFDLLKMTGALAVVTVLIFLTATFFKKFVVNNNFLNQNFAGLNNNNFKVISTSLLGNGKTLHLVEIKGRQLVIGCTPSSMNILTEFDEFDLVRKQDKFESGRISHTEFPSIYREYKGKFKDITEKEELEDDYS